jgi:hypothetical protein
MKNSINSKMISVVGSPASGKSTLATKVHHTLKIRKENSIFVGEAATDYIAEWGIPDSPTDQMVIFYKQLARERMYFGLKEWIVCDSSSILNYFYFRNLFNSKLGMKDIAAINHVQKEILKSISQWHKIYYVPPFLDFNVDDGVRYHDQKEIQKLDSIIKNYMDLEKIPYIDLSDVDIDDRSEWIIRDLLD